MSKAEHKTTVFKCDSKGCPEKVSIDQGPLFPEGWKQVNIEIICSDYDDDIDLMCGLKNRDIHLCPKCWDKEKYKYLEEE